MSSLLALILCIIFVIYMLCIDHKQFPEASISLWVPTLWMLLIWSKALGVWFGTGATIETGSYLDRNFLSLLFFIGLIILIKRNFNYIDAAQDNKLLLLLLIYMLLSCLWSDTPFLSFKRWSRNLIAIIMAFCVATESNPKQSLECVFRRLIYILIPFSFILIQYFGEYGRIYVHNSGDLMWVGVTAHKNQLCQLCFFSAFFLIWTKIKKKKAIFSPLLNTLLFANFFFFF